MILKTKKKTMSNKEEHLSNKMYTQWKTKRKTLKTTFVKYWKKICLLKILPISYFIL